ncbi:MAG: DinB family protein [Acidobacteriota bacterium]|nr:DinB family protein [Acidobacteriota bacterium]
MRQTVVTRWFIRLAGLMGLTTGTLEAQDPVATMYDEQVTLVEHEVVSLAKAMPADAYDFAPTEGRFAGMRSFGEQVTHLATMIYMTSALVLEERSPYGPGTHNNGPDELRSKDNVLPYLTDAIAYARRAVATLTVDNHLDPVPSAFGSIPRSAVAAGIAFHSFNHYGQMVVYARMNGVIPPASVPTGDEPVR